MKIVILSLISVFLSHGQPPAGRWSTIDDTTVEIKAVVDIQERNGLFCSRILKVLDAGNAGPVCDKCRVEDERYGKTVAGMEIIKDMKPWGDAYSDRSIFEPEEGRIYRWKPWMSKTLRPAAIGIIVSDPNLLKINLIIGHSNG